MIPLLFGILGLFFGIVFICSVKQSNIDKVAENAFNSKTGGVVKNDTMISTNSKINREVCSMDSDRIKATASFYNTISTVQSANSHRTLSRASTAKLNFSTTNIPEIDVDFTEWASIRTPSNYSSTQGSNEYRKNENFNTIRICHGNGCKMSVEEKSGEIIDDGDLYGRQYA